MNTKELNKGFGKILRQNLYCALFAGTPHTPTTLAILRGSFICTVVVTKLPYLGNNSLQILV